jgi:stage II sporulation protein D
MASDAISGAAIHNIPPLQGQNGADVCRELNIHHWTATRSSRTLRKRLNACAATMNLPKFSTIRTVRSVKPLATNEHGRPTTLAIFDRNNNATEVRARDFIRAVNASIPTLPKPNPTIWSSNLVASKQGANIEFTGTGMGHGVGLCQYGAQERAGRGESWEEILAWYYPNSTVST